MSSNERDSQFSQLSVDLKRAASRWEAAVQTVAHATESSTANKVLGEHRLLCDALAKHRCEWD